jgi:hypothetical protein
VKSDTLTAYIVRFPAAMYTASENAAALSAENEVKSVPVSCNHKISSVGHMVSPQSTNSLPQQPLIKQILNK